MRKWALLFIIPLLSFGNASASTALDVVQQVGLQETTRTFTSAPADYDNDGDQDVLIVRHNQAPARLMRNDGGVFTQAATFPKADRHVCAWADATLDGLLDVYCTIGANRGRITKANEFWVQGASGTFTNKTVAYATQDKLGRGRDVAWLDANLDGLPDIYIGNEQPRLDGKIAPNRLLLNQGGTKFVSGASYGLNSLAGGDCLVVADWNADGRQDVFVCGNDRARYFERSATEDEFVERSADIGLTGRWDDLAVVDWDHDGLLDLVRVKGMLIEIALQGETGLGAPVYSEVLLRGRHLGLGDLNGDGHTDIWCVQGFQTDKNQPDLVLLGGPGGLSEALTIGTEAGDGDSVSVFDIDGDGRSEALVLNGYGTTFGPTEVWRIS